MNRYVYKTVVYLSMFGLGLFHLAPYYTTWAIVLYYICIYGLMVTLVLSVNSRIVIDKYDKLENVVLMVYLVAKMIYHIAHVNHGYHEYLCALKSEVWAGVFTFVVLGMMLCFQFLNIAKYVKKR